MAYRYRLIDVEVSFEINDMNDRVVVLHLPGHIVMETDIVVHERVECCKH